MAAAKQKKKRQFDFVWEGVNSKRVKTGGDIEAASIAEARSLLRKQGIRVKKVKRKPKPLFSGTKAVKMTDISFASRQMATMIGAGIPVAQTLKAIGKGHESGGMEKLMLSLSGDVESGTSLSVALSKHPKYFDRLYTSMVEAGEESGKLDTLLDRVATYKEKMEAIKSKIKSAMMYPMIVLSIAAIVIVLLLLFVIPQFEDLFKNFGADLPTLTRAVVDASRWLQDKWYIFFGAVAVVVTVFIFFYRRSHKFRFFLDRVFLKFPIFGIILKKSAYARFSRTLSIIFGAGVPLVDGMDTVASSTGNRVFENKVMEIKSEISTGRSLANSMSTSNVFPNLMVQMVSSGEESGELETMLDKIADFYEREVDDAVDALASLIEPLMISVLGIIIGTMVLAMYMPIFKMAAVF
ncbi:MAG: type II secretion system F family protein [Arenicella sp.]